MVMISDSCDQKMSDKQHEILLEDADLDMEEI